MVTEDQEAPTKQWCVNLQAQDRMTRQTCLKQMLDFFEGDPPNVEALYEDLYLHLLKAYSDKFEVCRSLAASVVSAVLRNLPQNSKYLEYLAEVIAKRLVPIEIVEESEELRLQLVTQVKELVVKFKSDSEDLILKAYNDLVDILVRTTKDPFPAIQKESCDVVLLLANATPSFHYRAEALVKPISLMLFHRYSANRIAAIETLSVIALHIHTNNDCVGNLIMDLSKLLLDSVPNVRRECGRAGVRLGLELRDRYSHFSKILPLILCCLTDDIEDVQKEIQAGWTKVGQQYYEENEQETQQYLLADSQPENYPRDLQRPSFGCRYLVQRNLQVVNVILHEMEDFKEEVRLHSARLLRQVVIHSEKQFATQLVDAYAVLAKTCNDPEKIVAAEAMIIALYLGALLEYQAWGKHARDQLQKHPNLGNLKCFTAMFTAAGNEKRQDLEEVSRILTDSAICQSQKPEYQTQLLELCGVLTEGLICNQASGTQASTERNLYCVVMKVKALASDPEINLQGKEVVSKLATLTYASELHLHERHLAFLLDQIVGLDLETQDLSEPVVLLSGFVRLCGLNSKNIGLFQPKIIQALKCGSPDSRVSLFAAIAEGILTWKSANPETPEDKDEAQKIKGFVQEVLFPYLVWNAGRSAETVRTMATASLCATAQGVPESISSTLVALHTTQILPLIEDNAVKTRFNALRTLFCAGPIPVDQFKPLIFMVLSRLDDASADVREIAARLLGHLEPTEKEGLETTLDQVIERMVLHLEIPEQKLVQHLISSLKQLEKVHPEVYKKQMDAIPANHRARKLLSE